MPHTPPRHPASNPVHPKVKAAGTAGVVVAAVVAVLNALGVDVPEGVATVAVAVIGAIAGYLQSA